MKNNLLKKPCLLGIDIGTSSLKVALVNLQGQKLAEYRSFSKILEPAPGFVEQDAHKTWWQAVCKGVRHCLEESGINPANIAGICASGMVPNLCPVDISGNVVRPPILYRDNRAILEVSQLEKNLGLAFTQQDVLPKLLWIKNHEPENYSRIHKILNSHSYVVYKLTGNFSSDFDSAGIFGQVYCEKTRSWQCALMEEMGLNSQVLPPLYDPLDIVGHVDKAAAKETGLCPGTPVLAGTGDSYTILVGAGVVNAGEGLIYMGTAGTFLGLKTSLAQIVRKKSPFLQGDAVFVGNSLMGGEISRWFKDSFLGLPKLPLKKLDDMAEKIAPGANGLFALPHLLGERTPQLCPLSKGVIFGLTNAHTKAHTYRALLEGVAYVLQDSYKASGLKLKRIVICGGGANSGLWRQIIASVLNCPLQYPKTADNVLGTAYLAGLGLGIFKDFSTMQNQWLTQGQTVLPDEKMVEIYEKNFGFYKNLNQALQPAFAKHAALQQQARG